MRHRTTAAVTALVLTLTGCAVTAVPGVSEESGTTPADTPAATATATAPAAGPSVVGTWTVVAATGIGWRPALPARVEITRDAVAATMGCRMLIAPTASPPDVAGAAVTVSGGPVDFGLRPSDCGPDLDVAEEELADLLTGSMRWEVAGEQATLTATDGESTSLSLQRVLGPAADDPDTFADPGLEGSFNLLYWTSYESSLPVGTEPPPDDARTVPSGPTLVLTMADGRITAEGNCGTVTGTFALEAGHLEVDDLAPVPDAAAVDCDAWSREFDDRVTALLAGAPVLHRTGDEVSVSSRNDRNGVTVSRIAVPADAAFADRDWILQSYRRAGGPVEPAPGGVRAVLRYSDNRLSLTGGCNAGGGSAYIADGVIRTNGLMSTARGCGDPLEAVDEVMLEPFADAPPAYRIDGNTLTITSDTITVTYEGG
ncbi:META domain-containing protein [Nakamurella deserti]|uniref:META domain-containing protein n=1 Tax=Nakamurella deserti TaxID=2164074 RepID=UPI000DBE0BB5|nr:META domain-containing protein [Nakamurella deserti]